MSVVLETTLGDLEVDLFVEKRPAVCYNFLKLCKMKYYNSLLFHYVQHSFLAQTGDPTGEGNGGTSIFGLIEGEAKRYFKEEMQPLIQHSFPGLLSMVNCGNNFFGSQFFITLGHNLHSLDAEHLVFGKVMNGVNVLRSFNETITDDNHRPYEGIRITHTVIIHDPFEDPKDMLMPIESPNPDSEILKNLHLDPEYDSSDSDLSESEKQEILKEKEARARANILEIIGDLPSHDVAPPENVLFVCRLNPATTEEDLEIIFSRFGKIKSAEVIRDKRTGDSLQYAFIEFEDKRTCEEAYMRMEGVVIDERRIHVDFSQSVAKRFRWNGKGRGVTLADEEGQKDTGSSSSKRNISSNDLASTSRDTSGRNKNSQNRGESYNEQESGKKEKKRDAKKDDEKNYDRGRSRTRGSSGKKRGYDYSESVAKYSSCKDQEKKQSYKSKEVQKQYQKSKYDEYEKREGSHSSRYVTNRTREEKRKGEIRECDSKRGKGENGKYSLPCKEHGRYTSQSKELRKDDSDRNEKDENKYASPSKKNKDDSGRYKRSKSTYASGIKEHGYYDYDRYERGLIALPYESKAYREYNPDRYERGKDTLFSENNQYRNYVPYRNLNVSKRPKMSLDDTDNEDHCSAAHKKPKKDESDSKTSSSGTKWKSCKRPKMSSDDTDSEDHCSAAHKKPKKDESDSTTSSSGTKWKSCKRPKMSSDDTDSEDHCSAAHKKPKKDESDSTTSSSGTKWKSCKRPKMSSDDTDSEDYCSAAHKKPKKYESDSETSSFGTKWKSYKRPKMSSDDTDSEDHCSAACKKPKKYECDSKTNSYGKDTSTSCTSSTPYASSTSSTSGSSCTSSSSDDETWKTGKNTAKGKYQK